MKKVFLSLMILAVATLSASAQSDSKKAASSFTLDVGVNPALPIGNLGDVSSFGIGGFVKGAIPLSDNIDGTLTATYLSFSGKNSGPTSGVFTVLAGGSYKMDGGMHVDAGIGFGSLSETVSVPGFGNVSASSSGFVYRAGIGYKSGDALDFTLNFNGLSSGGSVNWLGLGIAYTFIK
jgi:hypothetical protein